MAKIFETPVDVERDHLAQESKRLRGEARHQETGAWMGAVLAFMSPAFNELEKLRAEKLHKPPSAFTLGFNKVMMWIGIIAGTISLANWWNKRSDAIQAEAKLSVLGGEEIKYPASMGIAGQSVEGKYCDRLKQEVASEPARQL